MVSLKCRGAILDHFIRLSRNNYSNSLQDVVYYGPINEAYKCVYKAVASMRTGIND